MAQKNNLGRQFVAPAITSVGFSGMAKGPILPAEAAWLTNGIVAAYLG